MVGDAWKELEEAASEARGYLADVASDPLATGAKSVVARLDAALRGVLEYRLQGKLEFQPSGRWAVVSEGRLPDEITSGEVFRVEVSGKPGLQLTRMEHRQSGGYYSVDGYELRNGLRASRVRE